MAERLLELWLLLSRRLSGLFTRRTLSPDHPCFTRGPPPVPIVRELTPLPLPVSEVSPTPAPVKTLTPLATPVVKTPLLPTPEVKTPHLPTPVIITPPLPAPEVKTPLLSTPVVKTPTPIPTPIKPLSRVPTLAQVKEKPAPIVRISTPLLTPVNFPSPRPAPIIREPTPLPTPKNKTLVTMSTPPHAPAEIPPQAPKPQVPAPIPNPPPPVIPAPPPPVIPAPPPPVIPARPGFVSRKPSVVVPNVIVLPPPREEPSPKAISPPEITESAATIGCTKEEDKKGLFGWRADFFTYVYGEDGKKRRVARIFHSAPRPVMPSEEGLTRIEKIEYMRNKLVGARRECLKRHHCGKCDNEDWGCCSWTEYSLMVALSLLLLCVVSLLTSFWIYYYRGGFSWSTDEPEQLFNYHPISMIAGFVFFGGFGMLVFRIFGKSNRNIVKLIHSINFALIAPLSVLGYTTIEKYHLHSDPPLPDLFSLHSWMGILTLSLYVIQNVLHDRGRRRGNNKRLGTGTHVLVPVFNIHHRKRKV